MPQKDVLLTSSNRKLPVLLPAEKISARVQELANEIHRDFAGREFILLVVLKGAFVFAADLMRALRLPAEVEFIRAASYHRSSKSSGVVELLLEPPSVKDRDILIVEDIVDTGRTMECIKRRLYERGARSVKVCTLLDKPSRREVEFEPDYTGFVIPDVFVTGYGIDYAESGRELADICIAEVTGREQKSSNQ